MLILLALRFAHTSACSLTNMDGLKSFLSEKAIEDRNLIGKMFARVANPQGRTLAAVKEAGIGAVREGDRSNSGVVV